MSGDVFGKWSMLLSRKIKLIAAFNHIHIFIDPDPDCEKSTPKEKDYLIYQAQAGRIMIEILSQKEVEYLIGLQRELS